MIKFQKKINKILITGCYKSGTSFVTHFLNDLKNAIFTNELGIWAIDTNSSLKNSFFNKFESEKFQFNNKIDFNKFVFLKNVDLQKTIKNFENCFDKKIKLIGDKHPLYLLEIHKYVPYVDKIIFIIRNPYDVIESQINQYFIFKKDLSDFEFNSLMKIYFPSFKECIECNLNWYKMIMFWDNFYESLKIPFFIINYNKIESQLTDLAKFLNINYNELLKSYKKHLNLKRIKKKNILKSDQVLPKKWLEIAEKYGVLN